MTSNGTDTAETTAVDTPQNTLQHPETSEQLTLLATPSVPLQFRLDERTRRAGLQHVAELRALMVAQAAGRRDAGGRSKPRSGRSRHDQVAA